MLAYIPALCPLSSPAISHKRPRGLWKRRRDAPSPDPSLSHASSSTSRPASSLIDDDPYDDDDDAEDDDDRRSSSSASSKRPRRSGAFDDHGPFPLLSSRSHFLPSCPLPRPASVAPLLSDLPYHAIRTPPRLLTLHRHPSPLSRMPSASHSRKTPDYEDWDNLKDLFAHAVERYDADDIRETLSLLRAVIRESHRFLTAHPDPSVVYADVPPPHRSSPGAATPTDVWAHDVSAALASRAPERPAAFHSIFGSALFYLGTLVAQDPSIPLPDEPSSASDYWLAALDVFQTGENLPALIGGSASPDFSDLTEDWRMAVMWGRALVSLADAKLTHSLHLAKERAEGAFCVLPRAAPFPLEEPKWPKHSLFAAIAHARPPVSRRVTLHGASAHDVMVLAMDQFSRGIFHMPHATYASSHNPPSHVASPPLLSRSHSDSPPSQSPSHVHSHPPPHTHSRSHSLPHARPRAADPLAHFSRPRELFTIASEVLGVAERLPLSAHRAYWAGWADSVFTQMRMEGAAHEAWRAALTAARGRCWLVMGSAHADELEAALEAGQTEVLGGDEAREAREGLTMAVGFFERAKGASGDAAARGDGGEEGAGRGEEEDVRPLLAEALFTLANLTADENKREELYSRAQAEAGEGFVLDGDDGGGGEDRMEVC